MNDFEKMLSGMLYNGSNVSELVEKRVVCKDLCHEYNTLKPSQLDERNHLIKKIIGRIGKNFWIEQNFWCDYGENIVIGDNFYSNHNLVILDCAKVTFGDNCFIAPNCGFYTAGHPIDYVQRNSGLEFAKPITVGNNVWIGGNVVVLPNVTIGDNTVIGAGSVVTRDIPSNVIAIGNPCKVLRDTTEKDNIKK